VNGDGGLSTSRLGFRGVEDLGGGLSAQFVLEYDLINIGTGGTGDAGAQAATGASGPTASTSRGFGPRYSYIGLSNKALGTLRLGRQETPIHGVVAGNLAGGANNVLGSLYSSLDGVNQLLSAQSPAVRPHDVFVDNAVTFISNNMNGVTVQLQTAQNAHSAHQNTPSAGTQVSGGSIGYTGVKNLNVGFGYLVSGVTTANTSNIKRTTSALGANYDFGVAKLFVVHTNNKIESLNLLTNKVLGDTKLTEVGVNAPLSKVINVFGSYFTGTRSTQSGSTSVVASNTGASSAADAKGFQLGTTYAFSKRTTAYGIYGTQEIKGKNEANGAKVDGTMFSLGLRHSF
jgi:predicted porin